MNWHHRIIAEKLEEVARGENKRVMIFVPPRHGKSMEVSEYFPAWAMGDDPTTSIILASYAAELAQGFGRKTRNLVASPEYQAIFPGVQLSEDSKSAGRWHSNKGGEYTATGIGGSLTGRGAKILIVDDPVKGRKEADSAVIREGTMDWWRSVARTRLAPGGSIVIMLTRWHKKDLAGQILKEAEEGGEPYEVIEFPAIATKEEEYRDPGDALWPARYDVKALETIKSAVGLREWLCLYQQSPVDNPNSEFKDAWFKKVSRKQAKHVAVGKYLTIDTALSKKESDDYTGWVENFVDAKNNWHISTKRMRVNSAQLLKLLFVSYEENGWDKIGIEETAYLEAIKPFLDIEQERRNVYLPIVPLKHGGNSKEQRIRGLIPRYEGGKIYHIENECAPLEEELLEFPSGGNDDIADSTAYQTQITMVYNDANDEEQERMIRQNRNKPTITK